MAEDVGKMLQLLDDPDLSSLYYSSIRKMQPAELVRRLDDERVSTRGHMSELRARLLRVEARKKQPRVAVPWYPEDEVAKARSADLRQVRIELDKVDAETPTLKPPTLVITPDELMKTMVQLGFWNPDGKPVEPSAGKARNARLRKRQTPLFGGHGYYTPLYSRLLNARLNDMASEQTLGERGLAGREARRRVIEDHESKIKLLASELRKTLQLDAKNFDDPQKSQDTSKVPVNQHPLAAAAGLRSTLSQQRGTSTPNEPQPSTSYDKEVPYQPKLKTAVHNSKPYTQFGKPFANEDVDEDPFEHVDSSDWIDDFIE